MADLTGDDLIGHERSDDCPCGPDVQLVRTEGEPDAWLVVHHSLDGRERTETSPDAGRPGAGAE